MVIKKYNITASRIRVQKTDDYWKYDAQYSA